MSSQFLDDAFNGTTQLTHRTAYKRPTLLEYGAMIDVTLAISSNNGNKDSNTGVNKTRV